MPGRRTLVCTMTRTSAGTMSAGSGEPSTLTRGLLPYGYRSAAMAATASAPAEFDGLRARRHKQPRADRHPGRVLDSVGDRDAAPQPRVAVLLVRDPREAVAVAEQRTAAPRDAARRWVGALRVIGHLLQRDVRNRAQRCAVRCEKGVFGLHMLQESGEADSRAPAESDGWWLRSRLVVGPGGDARPVKELLHRLGYALRRPAHGVEVVEEQLGGEHLRSRPNELGTWRLGRAPGRLGRPGGGFALLHRRRIELARQFVAVRAGQDGPDDRVGAHPPITAAGVMARSPGGRGRGSRSRWPPPRGRCSAWARCTGSARRPPASTWTPPSRGLRCGA